MYRQVGLKEVYRDFHRLFWRITSQDPLKHLRLTRIIHGVSCSAHLSTPCLTETANRTQKPHVAHAHRHAFYADDFLGGAHSLEEAKQLIQDLRDELLNYGFQLRKWSSSDPDLIEKLPVNLRAQHDALKFFAEDYKVQALLFFWQPNLDYFVSKCPLEEKERFTQRSLLSATSKLFDPLRMAGSNHHPIQDSHAADVGALSRMGPTSARWRQECRERPTSWSISDPKHQNSQSSHRWELGDITTSCLLWRLWGSICRSHLLTRYLPIASCDDVNFVVKNPRCSSKNSFIANAWAPWSWRRSRTSL